MNVTLDTQHEQLVRDAIKQGRAADAQTYVQSLIDAAEADRWIDHHRSTVEATLQSRLQQPASRLPNDWRDRIRNRAQSLEADRSTPPNA